MHIVSTYILAVRSTVTDRLRLLTVLNEDATQTIIVCKYLHSGLFDSSADNYVKHCKQKPYATGVCHNIAVP
jgi:hypothetical protein